tara:strand:+ start:2182 stop:2622 length:441 start_codon:yes stop_codon:yes gene_type:complete
MEIEEILSRIVIDEGLMLINQHISLGGSQRRLKLTVDTVEGVSLDEIADVSRRIQESERLTALLPEGFELEVTSPGLDSPLTEPYQFRRNLNRRVRIHHDAVAIPNPVEGRISSVDDELVIVENRKGSFDIPWEKIGKAILIIRVN